MYIGENSCSMNVHSLKHLAKCVERWGPLWAYSCFPFESFNGQIKLRFHGTRCMNFKVRFYTLTCMYNSIIPLSTTAGFFVFAPASSPKTSWEQRLGVSVLNLCMCCSLLDFSVHPG